MATISYVNEEMRRMQYVPHSERLHGAIYIDKPPKTHKSVLECAVQTARAAHQSLFLDHLIMGSACAIFGCGAFFALRNVHVISALVLGTLGLGLSIQPFFFRCRSICLLRPNHLYT